MDGSFKNFSYISLLLIGAVLFLYLIYLLSTLFVIVSVSVLLAFIFDPIVNQLVKEWF